MKRYKCQYRNGLILALCILAFARTLMAQVEAPQTKGVYGGIMSYIAAVSNGVATTRVYVSADSAAAVFYADVDFSKPNPFGTNLMFQAVPGLTSADNHGMANSMAVHGASGRLFVSYPAGVLSCTLSPNSLVTNIAANGVWGMVIEGSRLAYVRNDNHTIKMGYGTLSADGTFTESGSPATVMATDFDGTYNTSIGVHPTNHIVYLTGLGKTNIVRSSDSIENLSASTVFTSLALPNLTTNWTGDNKTGDNMTFGFGPDGRIFVGGYNPANTNSYNQGWELTYSDDNGVTWSPAITGGSGSPVWATVEDTANYWVYNGSAVSTNKGETWQVFGTQMAGARVGTRGSNHANRRVVADPTHPLVIYIATQCGFGACTNGGMTDNLDTIINISRGIEAAVVHDFDLTADKNIAWIAANGIRRATNFQGTPEWSEPKFPMNNDCLFVAVDKTDTSGLTVYAGGGDLYKTINGGPVESNPYMPTNWTCVFHPMDYGFNNVRVSAIEADGNIVVFGLRGTADNKGAMFLSTDGGSNWQEVVLNAGGVDVTELLLTRENGADVVYATVANDYLTTAYGVFRINVADVAVTHELTDTVNMHDLAVASDGRLYASGFDAQTNVVLYSKAAGGTVWTAISLNGYPSTKMLAMRLDVPLVTVGLDSSSNEVPYMLGYEPGYVTYYAIYYMTTTGTNITWKTSDALHYPDALQIKVLFWDDLVVGTSFGLYGQLFRPNAFVEGDFDGDRLADPFMVDALGNWYIWFSGASYGLNGGPWNLGAGTPVAADFDGDGLADPTMVLNGSWTIFASRGGWQPWSPFAFSVPGGVPVAADFDGDHFADPAMVANGGWTIWMSLGGWQPSGPYAFSVPGGVPVAGDFDGDRFADPTMVANGGWTIFGSLGGWQPIGPYTFPVPGGVPVAGDFDGDGLADPAMVVNNNWMLWPSLGGWQPMGPIPFVP